MIVNCGMKKIYIPSAQLNWLPNCQLLNKEVLLYFKGLSEDKRRADFLKNLLRVSL